MTADEDASLDAHTSRIGRRSFLGAIGGTMISTNLVGVAAGELTSLPRSSEPTGGGRFETPRSEHAEVPPFGDPESLRPHILAWGGPRLIQGGIWYDEIPPARRKEAILSLHPDANWAVIGMGLPPLMSEQVSFGAVGRGSIEFALDHGMGIIVGRNGNLTMPFIADNWYDNLSDSEKWRWPDGAVVDTVEDVAVRRIDGTRVTKQSMIVTSKHVPGVLDLYTEFAIGSVNWGTNGLWFDGGLTNFGVRDFSAWAVASFREHLSTLTDSRLAELGVEDSESLDPSTEILERTPLDSGEHPARDPLYREYVKQDYLAIREFVDSIRGGLAAEFEADPEDFVLFANQSTFERRPELVAITAEPFTFPAGESQRTVPPDFIHDFNTKFAVAAGRFEKSGFNMGNFIGHPNIEKTPALFEERGLDLSTVQADLLSIEFAEQVSNRAVGAAHLSGNINWGDGLEDVPGNWLRPDGSVPEKLEELTAFAWSARELLRGGTFAHDVAVVLSIPALMWGRAPEWGFENDDIVDSFRGAASLVRESQRPYDVVLVGHPEVWDDADMLARLSTYEQLLLPSVRALSRAQRETLVAALDDGVQVVVTDDVPTRDAEHRPLSEEARNEVLNHPNTTVVPDDPARTYWNGDGDGQALVNALEERPAQVITNTDSPLGVTIQSQAEPDRVVIQLVNYDFDLDTGEVSTLSGLEISLRDSFDSDLSVARLHRPGERPIPIESEPADGQVDLTIPSLSAWGTVVLGPDATAVSMAGEGAVADSAIEDAEVAIGEAQSDDRTNGLADARYFLDRAESAHGYHSFRTAVREAKQAEQWATAATPTPTIGIDTGHHQPDVGFTYDFFEAFRGTFIRPVRFTEVSEWTKDQFSKLDVLIVPPVVGEQASFGFTAGEVSRLEQFVQRGGGVLFLGRGEIADDHASVMGPFDVGFKPGTVRAQSEGGSREVHRQETNSVNQTVQKISGGTGPSLVVDPPDDATVLFEYPKDTAVWRDRCGDRSRQDCDEDAAEEPFSTIHRRGNGTVMTYGTTRHLNPDFMIPGVREQAMPFLPGVSVLRRGIGHMAARSQAAAAVSVDTPPTTAPDTTAPPSSSRTSVEPNSGRTTVSGVTEQETVAETPGFGIVSALAGLTGTISYLWYRHGHRE